MGRGARIKLEEIGRLGAGAQAQVRAALHLDRDLTRVFLQHKPEALSEAGKPRMRQDRGPKLNKTEAAFAAFKRLGPDARESLTFRIGNGVRYTPDFCVFLPSGAIVAYEVKGEHMWDDAAVKLKVAASLFPLVEFWLATPADRTKATWKIERVFA